MKILVTGSREFSNIEVVRQALIDVIAGHHGPHSLLHGGAKGADSLAALVAGRLGWKVESKPADWTTHTAECPPSHEGQERCRMAGHRRNAAMVATGPDIVVALYKLGASNKGTANCVLLARKAGLPVRRWTA